ncbi:MAG: hypothetical protein Q4P20_00090 [Eubacteriales bacterium]|nr:hypothetical protein [Eubacteriales bacterium]
MSFLLSSFDDVCARLEMHVERALFVHGDMTNETNEIDFDKDERWKLELVGRHTAMRAEIIFDYLWMMNNEIDELKELVQALQNQKKSGGQA